MIKEIGKYSTEEETPTIKISDNVTNSPELRENAFNTYFLTIIETMTPGSRQKLQQNV